MERLFFGVNRDRTPDDIQFLIDHINIKLVKSGRHIGHPCIAISIIHINWKYILFLRRGGPVCPPGLTLVKCGENHNIRWNNVVSIAKKVGKM